MCDLGTISLLSCEENSIFFYENKIEDLNKVSTSDPRSLDLRTSIHVVENIFVVCY